MEVLIIIFLSFMYIVIGTSLICMYAEEPHEILFVLVWPLFVLVYISFAMCVKIDSWLRERREKTKRNEEML